MTLSDLREVTDILQEPQLSTKHHESDDLCAEHPPDAVFSLTESA